MKVVWMYHDIMDLYGDKGNMMVLKKRCLDRGIPFELDTCGIGEEKDLSEYDLIHPNYFHRPISFLIALRVGSNAVYVAIAYVVRFVAKAAFTAMSKVSTTLKGPL